MASLNGEQHTAKARRPVKDRSITDCRRSLSATAHMKVRSALAMHGHMAAEPPITPQRHRMTAVSAARIPRIKPGSSRQPIRWCKQYARRCRQRPMRNSCHLNAKLHNTKPSDTQHLLYSKTPSSCTPHLQPDTARLITSAGRQKGPWPLPSQGPAWGLWPHAACAPPAACALHQMQQTDR